MSMATQFPNAIIEHITSFNGDNTTALINKEMADRIKRLREKNQYTTYGLVIKTLIGKTLYYSYTYNILSTIGDLVDDILKKNPELIGHNRNNHSLILCGRRIPPNEQLHKYIKIFYKYACVYFV